MNKKIFTWILAILIMASVMAVQISDDDIDIGIGTTDNEFMLLPITGQVTFGNEKADVTILQIFKEEEIGAGGPGGLIVPPVEEIKEVIRRIRSRLKMSVLLSFAVLIFLMTSYFYYRNRKKIENIEIE
jgi:hypothetical protein